jgi:hypothetical protein
MLKGEPRFFEFDEVRWPPSTFFLGGGQPFESVARD